MKRDLQLIKDLLIYVEEIPYPRTGVPPRVEIAGYEYESIQYHLTILHEAGYITGPIAHDKRVFPERLTWEGHDFLEAARNDSIWKKTMALVKSKGGNITIEILKTLLVNQAQKLYGL